MRKGKILTAVFAIISIMLVAVIGIVNASNTKYYLAEVIDDGSSNLNGNDQTEITKKIIQDNSSNLIYEVNLKNKIQSTSAKEVTILVDTSRSTGINDPAKNVIAKAANLAESLYDNVSGIKIAVADSTGIKLNLSTNKEAILNAINSLEVVDGDTVDESIVRAGTAFSTDSNSGKTMIIFTDATDTMGEVKGIQDKGISVISILDNMTRQSFESNGVSTIGTTYMVDNINIDNIISSLNKTLSNIVVTDEFADEITKYFDFSVESKGDNDTVTPTATGYTWNIPSLTANTTATLRFKLTLKDFTKIDASDAYKNINTSKNMNVKYEDLGASKTYDVAESPVILLCEKYSVTIQAVSEENTNLPVEGIDVKVVATTESGKVVYDGTLQTDSNGKVIIDNLKTLGKLTFTATPQVNKTGYQSSSPITFDTYNEETGKLLKVTTEGIDSTIDDAKRDILVKLPISTQKFTLEVNLAEKNNTNVKVGNTEFRLIQPKINNKYELSALYGTTGSNGKVIFTPSIMPKAGTYDYILSQTTEAPNYESMGNVTLRITFDDSGKVTKIEKKYNDKVEATRINDSYAIVNVVNVNKATDNFNFEVEVSDKINNNSKIEGAIYNVEVTTQDGGTVTYSNQTTDSNGKINLTLSGSGYITIKVTEVNPKVGYYKDSVVKEFVVERTDGTLKGIMRSVPADLDVAVISGENKVKLNLISEMNANPSVIQIQVADMQENDIFIPGVTVKLIGLETKEEYTAVTDAEGKATFLVQPQETREDFYPYKVELVNSTIPNSYSPVTGDILIGVKYDENNEICETSDNEGPIWHHEPIQYTEDDFTYHAGYFGIGLELNEADSYNFKINLSDYENGKPLQGATYNITIDDGTNVRKISNRATNSDGMISTRLIPADHLTIKIQQVKSRIGYVADTTEETIELEKKNGIYQIVNQDPYDYSDRKNGAVIDDKDITYYHTNERKNSDSVLLNLYINKMDKNDNRLGNIKVKVSSDTLKNSDGQLLNEQLETDQNGYIQLEKIKVTNIEIPKDCEHFLYIAETDGEGNEIESTKIKLKLTFRYNENKVIVELTNAESTWGNRLIKNKTFNGYETDIAYESNLYLDIYGNYEDVGNFSLDLRKLNEEGNILNGAKYDVVITRTDGTKIIKRDLEITDNVEFEGVLVSEGTTIDITETQAPEGYKENEYTETLKIAEISDDGTVSVDLQDAGYSQSRASIKDIQTIPLSDGTSKTCVTLDLIDQNLNTFKFGITTKDTVSDAGIQGFKYYFHTSKGAQVESEETNSEGKVTTRVGASYAGQTVEYTIKEIQTAKYYKGLKDPITLKIVYADDGTVDANATIAAQTDVNYTKTWDILATNTTDGNDIDIVIKNEPQDPLKVELQTVDKITGAEINNIEYQINPTINLEGKGTTDIDVGYVAPSSLQIYTLKQVEELTNYKPLDTQTFRLLYDENGDIVEPSNLSSNLEFVSKNGKTIKFKVYVEPRVPIVITALGFFDNKPLDGTEYTIKQDIDTTKGKTNSNGIATVYNGILGKDEDITYTITEEKITQGYVKLDAFRIKVHYNSNREIDNVSLEGETNRWISVTYKTPSEATDTGYNGNDKGIVQITLKHYPEFLINITNKDRLDNSNLSGALYKVTSTINTSDENVLTDSNGLGIAKLGKTLMDDKIVYTIEETRAASLYQTIEKPVKVEVTFDENGYVTNAEVIDGEDFASASKIANITDPRDNFAINVEIKNCKMLKFNITAVDSQDSTYALRGLTFTAQSELDGTQLSSSTMQTDINGQGVLGLDKDYANRTIKYTIKETRKVSGYQFPSEDLIIEVTYDSQGKIIRDSVKILQGAGYTEITNIDPDGFNIDLKIVNDETEDFGVAITAVDKYDDSIKLKDVDYDVYMMTSDYARDDNYTGNTTTDTYGEGYVQYGKYVSSNPNGNEVRSIRIKETNLSDQYRTIRAEIVVNVTFDANGIVQDVSVPGGYNTYLGWVADTRFVTVTHTRHTVSVTIKHYPYLFMNVKAVDMYTGDTLAGKYKISTTRGPGYSYVDASKLPMQNKISKVQSDIYASESRGATLDDLVNTLSKDPSIDRINYAEDRQSATFTVGTTVYTVNSILEVTKAQAPGYYAGTTGYTNIDYIGNGIGEILEQNYTTTDDGNWAKVGVGPTETDGAERTYYIYEEQAPSSPMQYQQYRPRYLSWEYSKIVATITVKYDNKGRIEKYTIDGTYSNNNIKEFLDVEILDGTNLGITIKYAPITTMDVTAIDTVSKQGLSNIRVSPYGGNDYGTKTSYEYRTIGYYTTDSQGKTNYTYWGGNINKGENEYVIDTSLMGYQGYFATGTIRIKVAYDDYGRISAATVLTKNENNLPNAEVESFENNNLKIKILYNRKFNLKIEKQDEYDENTKLTAQFDIQSNKEEKTSITSDNLTTVGMIRPGEKVEYSLSETTVPQGYIPLDNLKFTVTYNKDGTIKEAKSESPLFEVSAKRADIDTVRPTTVEDLRIKIKNEPRFAIKLNVMDKFYNEKKLSDVTFEITSDKGDTATGNPITDQNGSLTAYIAKPYKNETIRYTIKQTSTPNGYYPNTTPIVVEVTFNENGRIKEYTIISGNDVTKIDTTKFQNERYIELDVLGNRPKDIVIGIDNKDKTTNAPISGIQFKVTSQEVSGGSAIKDKTIITDEKGKAIESIDTFKEKSTRRVVNYTISQVNKPDSYRKIQDVVVQVTYNEDGSMLSRSILSNPSNVNVQVALGGRLQYCGDEPVHILLGIPNDNAYDINIKDEDKNYAGLGIEGTLYDVSINGEQVSTTTGSDGIASVLGRQEVGTITIQISENTPGIGYKADNNNNTTIVLEKGETNYSLKLISNSNPTFAEVNVNEDYGTVDVKFKNETRSSITLVKDVKEVKYDITSKESDGNGGFTNEQVIGTAASETEVQEKLHYELGVTPQNKTIVYTFKQVDYPADYYKVGDGTFEVTVEYDMYGHIKENGITTNSNRVDAIEDPERSHDIIVIVSEYQDNNNNPDDPSDPTMDKDDPNYNFKNPDKSSITVIKDNKDVRYQIGYKEIDDAGNESNARMVGDESTELTSKEQLYYETGKLPKNKTIVFTIKEIDPLPSGYTSNGIIEVTAKVNDNRLIYDLKSNTDKAKVKLIPTGSNDIAVIIGEEYGSLTLTKSDENVKYKITSKEENSDGTTANEKTVFEESEADASRRKIYICLREQIVSKTIVYTFTEQYIPEGYKSRGTFEIKVTYDGDGKVTNIENDNYFLATEEDPIGSGDIYATVRTDEQLENSRIPYTIKVVSQEVDTNLRINDSMFDIDITQAGGDLISQMKDAKTANVEKKGYILEKGVIKVEDIKKDGEIDIHVNQKLPTADGYKFGSQKTSGLVKVKVDYTKSATGGLDYPEFTKIDDDGLDVSIDNTNKVITVKVNNEPEINMEITDILKTKDDDGNIVKTPLDGSKFTITSKIQTKTDITDTDLNVTTKMTDENGKTETKAGRPYAGKTVLYTIHQEEREEYEPLQDIVALVQYDTKGNVKYYEIISCPDDAEVTGEIGTRNVQITVTNTIRKYKHGYKFILRKHHIDDGEYGELIPGAKFKIEVEQEYGEYNTTWEAVTDSEGMITSDLFDGYGNITIKVTELDAPEGFKTDGKTMIGKYKRDKNTGKVSEVDCKDMGFEYKEDESIIYLDPSNEPRDNLYTIIANKVDKKTGKQITDSYAQFDVKMIGQENVGTEDEPNIEDVETYVGSYTTDNKGKAKIENLQKPEKPGIYKYEITETQAPDGYVKLDEPVVLQVEFEEDTNGKIVMKNNPTILSGDASIKSKKNDLLNITINNLNEKDLNKYTLDITKKDAETGEPIENMALFKVWLPDSNNTALYAETMNNDYGKGKLDYCYIEQDKDYSTRLTRMDIPTEEKTLKYIFREVSAPEGYKKIDEDLELDIVFKKEESTGKMIIDQIISSNDKYMKVNTPTPCNTDTVLSIDILNNQDKGEEYTIHYDANDNGEGAIVPADQIKYEDEDIQLSTEEPTRNGYTFKGWATSSDAKEAEFTPGDTFTLNQNTTLYAVWDQPLYLKTDKYVISTVDKYSTDANAGEYVDGDQYIFGVKPGIGAYRQDEENKGTITADLIDNITTNADKIEIITRNNEILGNDELIGTGMKLVLTKGEEKIELTIIVLGDVDGNGKLEGSDKTKASKYISQDDTSQFDTVEKKLALDVNLDGKIRPSDLTLLRQALANDDNSQMGGVRNENNN